MKIKNLILGISIFSLFAGQVFAANNPADTSKYKSSGPIEISSDSLEIFQKENKAIFIGHVIAVQGDVRLKSEKMTILYKNTEKKDDKKAKKTESSNNPISEKNSIEKIIAEEKVFLSTPEETASGASGIYDVVNHKIFLNDNVVLTRDKNVLKGDRLVYDFATGKSELNSLESRKPSDAGKPKQRVKAIFVPNKDSNKEPSPKK
jgi:lipopolysaccharide export system protein LptA